MTTTELVVEYTPHGAVRDWWLSDALEAFIDGPAGTGKTRGILEYFHLIALLYPGSTQLICRKTNTALTGAALRTFRERVIANELRTGAVKWFGGSKAEPASFKYANGSRIVVTGLDNPEKTFSTEYDNAYVNECTECTEDDWELLGRSLRNGFTPHQRLVGDCNPSTDRHHLLKRWREGRVSRFKSTIRDNPRYWDLERDCYTTEGEEYVEGRLGNMTGTRRQRLYEGEWVGMENAVYPQLDPSVQLKSLSAEMERQSFRWVKSVGGADYGEVHLSALAGLSKDSLGRIWVRRVWTGAGGNRDAILAAWRNIAAQIRIGDDQSFIWGLTDPNQGYMASDLGWESASRARRPRIDRLYTWLDAGALLFDADDEEVREAFNEAMGYHWERRENAFHVAEEPARIDDNRIAAIEYAGEAMEELPEASNYPKPGSRTLVYKRKVAA